MSNDKTPIRIESICIVHKDNPDSEEEGMEEIGIFIEADISYPISHFHISTQDYHEHRRIATLKSSGLWGIASNSPFDYQVSVEKEQLVDLKEHLSIFGVDISNFHEVRVQMRRE